MKFAKTDHLYCDDVSEIDAMFSIGVALLEFASAIVHVELALLAKWRCPFPSRRIEASHPLLRFLLQPPSALSIA